MQQDFCAQIAWDPRSHHALGGGSYAFKEKYPEYLDSLLPKEAKHTLVNVIIQPNSSPHIGTLSSLVLAFVVASRLQKLGRKVLVVCDLWDQAKGEQININGTVYQRSLRDSQKLILDDYEKLLAELGSRYDVKWEMRFEAEFLKQDGMSDIIHRIINNREAFGKSLAPSSGVLALRAPCPTCGLVDKYAKHNVYSANCESISFRCPYHGPFTYNIRSDVHKLQFNCQLGNLLLGLYYQGVDYGYIEICGSDYAGFWQEQLLWRHLSKPIIIVYTPLICDWSGAKVSKSWYLRGDAYDYLSKAGQEYLLNYKAFERAGKDFGILCREVETWVEEPYRLFRAYTIHYMHLLFSEVEVGLGAIHTE